MKTRLITTLSLFAVLIAACAPATAPITSASPIAPIVIAPSSTPLAEVVSPTLEAAPSQVLTPTAFPIATSRGPHLEATDPKTVTMASGNLQFVEFFEFW